MDERIGRLTAALWRACEGLPHTRVMEVCGTHTHAVAKSGLKALLPDNVSLLSGPGCPVCVTSGTEIACALALAQKENVTLFSFGDMLRVPVQGGDSLLCARERGSDVRIAVSPMDALRFARENRARTVVWFGVGFETSAPHTAALILRATEEGLDNLCVLSAHKTMPAALMKLLYGTTRVHALLCPGHVAAIVGAEVFSFVPERLGLPAAVAGFEPAEILAALVALLRLRRHGEAALQNLYPSAVREQGNPVAQALVQRVFEPGDATWRGLGRIEGSALAIRAQYAAFDAQRRFEPPDTAEEAESPFCRCPDILRGEAEPEDCALFGGGCDPAHPQGPCMVSSEGACAAAYRYGGAYGTRD